jgi:hypothetical protein
MVSIYKLFFLLSFVTFSTVVNAQNRAEKSAMAKETSKIYYYQFEGQLTPETSEALREEILAMQFVTEAKIEYKAEKSAGQVRLLATEKFMSVDTDFEFSIYNLKQLLIRYNLIPSVYRSEVISK